MPETIPRRTAEAPIRRSGRGAWPSSTSTPSTVADAVADVASMAGENVTTTIRADFKELQADFKALRTDVNARIDTLASEMNVRIGHARERDGRPICRDERPDRWSRCQLERPHRHCCRARSSLSNGRSARCAG